MAELKEFRKKSYTVQIIRVPAGLCIYNTIDNSNCKTDADRCFVIIGLKGEQWPVKGKDLKRYLNLDGTKVDPSTWKLGERKVLKTDVSGPHILVYFASEKETFPAPASWGMTEPLVAKPGDAIAYTMREDGTPDVNDKYVVSRMIFERTYTEVI